MAFVNKEWLSERYTTQVRSHLSVKPTADESEDAGIVYDVPAR